MHAEADSRALTRLKQLRASASISDFELADCKTLARAAQPASHRSRACAAFVSISKQRAVPADDRAALLAALAAPPQATALSSTTC